MIDTLPELIEALPAHLRAVCARLYQVDRMRGYADPPPSMLPWVVEHFGDVARIREQTIVKVTHRLTLESALFNPVRARRPNAGGTDDAALERAIAAELAEHDVFRDPERDTTADVFGRIRGRYSISASNVAKYDGWHGLVIFDDPHPLRFGPAQVADYLDVAMRWLAAAHARDPAAIYPIITWNCLPKSGATLVHGHMQVALTRGMHFARVESWRRAAAAYRAEAGRRYLADFFALHAGLGLALPARASQAVAHLTPARNRELVLHAELATAGDRLAAAHAAVAALAPELASFLRCLVDEAGVRSFNLALALPALAPTPEDWADVGVLARVGDRGNPLTHRSDIGAMELYAATCITADPFEVAELLRTPPGQKNSA